MSHPIHDESHTEHLLLSPRRLEAFSDAVFAIILTITVLEMKVPSGDTFASLKPLIPVFIAYAISFQAIGTYWNNHYHLLRATKHVTPGIMWANLYILFWLSFIPFTTGWIGENHGGMYPTAVYSFVLLMSALGYNLLQNQILKERIKRAIAEHGESANTNEHYKKEFKAPREAFIKGTFSEIFYVLAVICAFVNPIISDVLIFLVALMWFIPDNNIKRWWV